MSGFYERVAARVSLLPAGGPGWRAPQAGALGAVIARWSLTAADPTLVSIPTGAGKTGLALAAPFLTAHRGKVLVVVPKRDLRDQLVEAFSSQELLHRLGVLPTDAGTPEVMKITGRVTDWQALEHCDVAVALPNSVSPAYYTPETLPPADLFDLLVFDEAHHAPSRTWRALLDHFSPTPALLLTATPRRRDGQTIPGTQVYYYPLRLALEEGFYKPIEPVLLDAQEDKAACDRAIARRATELLAAPEWHAKGAVGATPSVRVNDFQVVIAQAIRSRRSITSTSLWEIIGRRLDGQESPAATVVAGSDDEAVLRRRLALEQTVEGEPEPWTVTLPVVRATIGVVQPGLTAGDFRRQLTQTPVPPAAGSLRELFSVLADTAISDGTTLRIVVSE